MILSPADHFELLMLLDISQCFTVHLAPKALFQNFEQHFLPEQAEQRHMMRLQDILTYIIPGPPFGTEKLAQTKFWYTKVENEQVLLLT